MTAPKRKSMLNALPYFSRLLNIYRFSVSQFSQSSRRCFTIPFRNQWRRDRRHNSSTARLLQNGNYGWNFSLLSVFGVLLVTESSHAEELILQTESDGSDKPIYRRSEIKEHNTKELGIWITHGNAVYDITKFIVNHPGGQEKIKLAAGGAVEPFWKIYRQHYNSNLAMDALKPLLIGYLHPDDVAIETAEQNASSDDPYSNDPAISPIQTFHMKKPINSETPSALLSDTWVTPKEMWFNRNHHPVPHLDPEQYRLSISGVGVGVGVNGPSVELTLKDLKEKFKKHKVRYRSSLANACNSCHAL